MLQRTAQLVAGMVVVGVLSACGAAGGTGSGTASNGAPEPVVTSVTEPMLLPTEAPLPADDATMSGSVSDTAVADAATSDAATSGMATPGGTMSGENGDSGASAGSMGSGDASGADTYDDSGAVSSDPADWMTYTDTTYGFSLLYPANYQVSRNLPGDMLADQVDQISFVDAAMAASDLPMMAPLTVDVFTNAGGLSLDAWLDQHSVEGQRDAVTINGASGYKVTLSIEIAPNEFTYIASGDYIYRLTPLGPDGIQMLQSFQAS